MHARRLPAVALLAALAIGNGAARADVYAGVAEDGSIVLSSTQQDDAPELYLRDAEPQTTLLDPMQATPPSLLPFIEEASLASQLPAGLIAAVIAVESNYNPRALSSKGARGLMQLMPDTARRFGIANIMDPRDNILTGSRYLRWLLDYFGQDMELAIAAYNAGENAVVKAGRQIPAYRETRRYVPRVLALYRRTAVNPT